MSTTPTVSVIIPNYNSARTLDLVLRSVFAQTLQPYEVIVSDDASTDDSPGIAARHPCRVVRAARNGGVSAARNAGVAASSGEILFFLDADQALAPDALENAVRLLREDPTLGCVHGVIAPEPLIDDGLVERYRVLHAAHWRGRPLGRTPTAIFGNTAMPRAVFDEVGPFDPALRDSEDIEYSERLSARHGILLTDRVVAYHDEEDRLLPMLREQFRRAQLLVPFAAAHRGRPGAMRANNGLGVASALFTACTAPLLLLAPVLPALALPTLAGLAVFAVSDPALIRTVRKHRGVGFLVPFLALHLLVNLQIALGAATGWARGLVQRDFGVPTARVQGRAG
ncbi:glycosyltransferase family 2 protein [Marinactinospora rubrisoli]|uniref:Glycosyltransferase family 2 protein n=1 Tax=Marinactinospora rubrisoli TaxID=2715399 RepID=A0ABW2KBE3_9ACTN